MPLSHKRQHKNSSNPLRLSGRTGTFTKCVLTVLTARNIQNGLITRILSILPLTPASLSALVFSGSAAFYHVLPGQILPQRANENQGGTDQVQAQMGGGRWREERGERV